MTIIKIRQVSAIFYIWWQEFIFQTRYIEISYRDRKREIILSISVIAQAFNWLVCYLLTKSEEKIQDELNKGKVMRFNFAYSSLVKK